MSGNPEHKRVRSAAGKVLRAWNAVHKSMETWPRPGFRKNMYGQYWSEDGLALIEAAYRSAIGALTDDSERFALSYSLAALYQQSLRLDKAAAVCRAILNDRPDAYNFLALLSRVEAARGNLEEALRLARQVDETPNSRAFRVSISELEAMSKSGGVV
jgi:predicted Zn-dependent protease